MGRNDFPPIPPNATGPPPPDYGEAGEDKNQRKPPGGYLGEDNNPPDSNGGRGWGPPVPPVEPDPVEPDYSADKWDYIHYAASRADRNPSEMKSRIRGGNVDARASETRYTPLHVAVKFGQSEAVRQLIAARADVDRTDVLGQTPLGLACCYEVGTGIPRQLLDAGADMEIVDKYSWKPIFWAASKGYYDVVLLLVERGARKNDKDKRGQRPADVASNQRIRNLLN